MARVVVGGMPEAAAGGGVMLKREKAMRRKRKDVFVFQMCFAGGLLGLVGGLRSVAHKAGLQAGDQLVSVNKESLVGVTRPGASSNTPGSGVTPEGFT